MSRCRMPERRRWKNCEVIKNGATRFGVEVLNCLPKVAPRGATLGFVAESPWDS